MCFFDTRSIFNLAPSHQNFSDPLWPWSMDQSNTVTRKLRSMYQKRNAEKTVMVESVFGAFFGQRNEGHRRWRKKSTLKRTILTLVMNKGRTEHNILELKDTSPAQIILSYTRNTLPSCPTFHLFKTLLPSLFSHHVIKKHYYHQDSRSQLAVTGWERWDYILQKFEDRRCADVI